MILINVIVCTFIIRIVEYTKPATVSATETIDWTHQEIQTKSL